MTGTYTFSIRVSDRNNHSATQPFALTIYSATPAITTASLPDASVNTQYSQTFAAAGGTPPYTWSQTSGSSPPGFPYPAAECSPEGQPPQTHIPSKSRSKTAWALQFRGELHLERHHVLRCHQFAHRHLSNGGQRPLHNTLRFSMGIGSAHTLAAPGTQAGGTGIQYVYASWSDSGAQTHSITAPSSSRTYTANFATQYYLTTSASPAAGGSITPGGWYSSGAIATVSATPNAGYVFTGFSGDLSGTTNPGSLTMTGPMSVAASFNSTSPVLILTTSVPAANAGAPYSATLAASGGTPPYSWSVAPGSSLPSGLVLNPATGEITGNPAVSGNFQFTVQVNDAKGVPASQTLSLTVALPTLSINGGSNSAEVASSTSVSLAFNLYDQANGANDIAWGQFYLADSSGNPYCYGDWGRPDGLDLYDGNTGTTHGFGINQSDNACTVSLASITNSPSDPTEVTVVLNLNFYPSAVGVYTVLTQTNYGSGYAGPWESAGTLIIDPGSTVDPTSGSGFAQAFTASFLDTNGAADIAQARLLIQAGSGSSLANQCIMRYDRAANNLYLLADDGVNYLGPITGGGYDTLANSQCVITGGYNLQMLGNILQVDFSVLFTTGFEGSHQMSLSVLTNAGSLITSGTAGSWSVASINPAGGGTPTAAVPSDAGTPVPPPSQPVPLSSPTAQNCSDLSGTWEDPNFVDHTGHNIVWKINQDSSGNVSGTLTESCGTDPNNPVVYDVSGSTSYFTATLNNGGTTQYTVTCNDGKTYWTPPQPVAGLSGTCVPQPYGSAVPTSEPYTPPPPSGGGPPIVDGPPNTETAYAAMAQPLLSWTRKTYPPAIGVTFDMTQQPPRSTVTLTGPPGKSGTIIVALNGNYNLDGSGGGISSNIGQQSDATVDQTGVTNFPIPANLVALPYPVRYTSMTVTWEAETLEFEPAGASRAPDLTTMGYTRFSKYNTSYESECKGTVPGHAWVFQGPNPCDGADFLLNAKFILQASINGGGFAANAQSFKGLMLKTFSSSSTPNAFAACHSKVPPGYKLDIGDGKGGNVFALEPPPNTGACGNTYPLTDATTLAVFPGVHSSKSPHWNCGEAVTLLNQDNTIVRNADGTVDVKQVGDTCPICGDSAQFGGSGAVAHIDMYTSDKGCAADSFANQDWGKYFPIRIK